MDAEEDERKPAANDADDATSNKSSKDDSATAGTAGTPDSDSAKEKYKSKSAGATNKYLNTRVAKQFHAGLFFGTITKYYPEHNIWFVEYDDGDEEEFVAGELNAALRLYKKRSKQDTSGGKRASTNANAEATPAAKKRKKTATPRTSSRRSPRCVAGI
jgi:hypothetical protein